MKRKQPKTTKPEQESNDSATDKVKEIEIEKVQDNATARKLDDMKAKKGEEVQTHSGAETVNVSPEITALSQAADSDGSAESSSKGEAGNVYSYAIIN